jgi:hypothetical protein
MAIIAELVIEALMGFTQMFVTALWQTKDPAIIAKRNACLTVYGVAATIFFGGLGALFLHAISLLFFLGCVGITMILLLVAGQLADHVEKLVTQQKTPDPEIEG